MFNNSLGTSDPANKGQPTNVSPTDGPPTAYPLSPLTPSGVSICMVQKFTKQRTYEPTHQPLVFNDIIYPYG